MVLQRPHLNWQEFQMPLDDEGEAEAVGAEKSPRKVGLFVLTLMVGIVIALCLVLLYLHFHAPALK
jgi:hypothetical protein